MSGETNRLVHLQVGGALLLLRWHLTAREQPRGQPLLRRWWAVQPRGPLGRRQQLLYENNTWMNVNGEEISDVHWNMTNTNLR